MRLIFKVPSTLFLVLPPQSIELGQEISNRELEQVAGGWSADSGGCGTCARPVESYVAGCIRCR